MNKAELKEFMEQFDLGFDEDCYTIAKVTFERKMKEMKE